VPTPLVSVLLTSYNHSKFIENAINSVLTQDFSDYELLIWDDCSSDGSWELIQSFSDSRIRKYRSSQNTAGDFFDEALREARGELIAIHHSDDIWLPGKLTKQVTILDENPAIGACFAHASVIDDEGIVLDKHPLNLIFRQPNKSRHEWLRHFFFDGNCLCHPSALVKRSCYKQIGGYNTGLMQYPDLEMWIRLCSSHDIYVIPEVLVQHRMHANASNQSALTISNSIRGSHEHYHILDQYRRLGVNDLMSIFPECIQYIGVSQDHALVDYILAMTSINSSSSSHMHRSFGADLLTKVFSTSENRSKLLSLHNVRRNILLDDSLLVDHYNEMTIRKMSIELQRPSIRDNTPRHPANTNNRDIVDNWKTSLLQQIADSDSLKIFKDLQCRIPERSFHLFNHILHDIRTCLGHRKCIYLEIGSYVGASALLMLNHHYPTSVICVDPLSLPSSHFGGGQSQDQTLLKNLQKLSANSNFQIAKAKSQDPQLLAALYAQKVQIDILFIDGDHRFDAVLSDFFLYSPLVNSGGFIVFDDYCDSDHSPDVRVAVDLLVERYIDRDRYGVIGLIPDLKLAGSPGCSGNEFVIRKFF